MKVYCMKIALIYPKWPKLKHQPKFNLPPHAPVVLAAAFPDDVEVIFFDEHVEEIDFAVDADLIAISNMLTSQAPRAWEIADKFRALGKTVILGGIATMLHAEEAKTHADAIYLGEAEGYIERNIEPEKIVQVFQDNDVKKLKNTPSSCRIWF